MDLMDFNFLFLIGNIDIVYVFFIFDFGCDGVMVIEIFEGQGLLMVNDVYFWFVIDMGVFGLDQGKGGKYLILLLDYEGDFDLLVGGYEVCVDGEIYFVFKFISYINWFIVCGFFVDGKMDMVVDIYFNGLKIYLFKDKVLLLEMEFFNVFKQVFNIIYVNMFEFFNEFYEVIVWELVFIFDLELCGLVVSIGIEKGKFFEFDVWMMDILNEVVVVGNVMVCIIWFKLWDLFVYFYENSGWYMVFIGGNY